MDVSFTIFKTLKIACFPHPNSLFDTPSGGTPCDVNGIYTSLKSTFNGLKFSL